MVNFRSKSCKMASRYESSKQYCTNVLDMRSFSSLVCPTPDALDFLAQIILFEFVKQRQMWMARRTMFRQDAYRISL